MSGGRVVNGSCGDEADDEEDDEAEDLCVEDEGGCVRMCEWWGCSVERGPAETGKMLCPKFCCCCC
jgi:hypothetical protein